MGALLAWLTAEAETQKVLLTVEDLHWADASTIDFFGLLLEQMATSRILAIFTFRPQFLPQWAPRSHLSTLALGPLGQAAAEAVIARVSGGKLLPTAVLQQVLERTEGIPLFLEELTKMVLELGLLVECNDRYELGGALPPLAIPATLRDSLIARLDRLPAARVSMQVAAVLGRMFSFKLLENAVDMDAEALDRDLAELVRAEILYQHGLGSAARYSFKHEFIRETIYELLLKSARQQLHARVAELYEGGFSDAARVRPEIVAHHFTQAGLGERAVSYWRIAGEFAIEKSAYVEAVHHFSAALDLVRSSSERSERADLEQDLSLQLGLALIVIKGPSAPEVETLYRRAYEAGRSLRDSSQQFKVLHGLWYNFWQAGRITDAIGIVDEMMSLANRLGDNDLILEANHVQWTMAQYRGLVGVARAATEQGIARYDRTRHRAHLFAFTGHNSGMCARAHGSIALWLAGFPDQAQRMAADAINLGRDLCHPLSLSFALWLAGITYQLCGARDICARVVQEAQTLSQEHQFAISVAMCQILAGWVESDRGNMAHGIGLMEEGIRTSRSQRRVVFLPYGLALLAAAQAQAGALSSAHNHIVEAMALAGETGQGFFVSELYRLKAEIQWAASPSKAEEAATLLLTAIDVAERQSAMALRFRAEVSLARLRAAMGLQAEAKAILVDGYGKFAEGFQTRDLIQGKALLGTFG